MEGGLVEASLSMSWGAQPARGGSRMTVESGVMKSRAFAESVQTAVSRFCPPRQTFFSGKCRFFPESAGEKSTFSQGKAECPESADLQFVTSSSYAALSISTRVRWWLRATERPMVPTPA